MEGIESAYYTAEEQRLKERSLGLPDFSNQAPASAAPGQAPEQGQQKHMGFWEDVTTGLKNSPKNIVGGAVDAGQEMINLVDDMWDWAASKSDYLGEWDAPTLPNFAPAESNTGRIMRSMSQFLTGFLPWTGGLKVLGVGNGIVRGLAAGALSQATVFDPYEERLSNMVHEISGVDSGIANDILSFLEADKNDGALEARLKAGLEGLLTDIGMEGGAKMGQGVLKALKIVKARHSPEIVAQANDILSNLSDEQRAEMLAKQADSIINAKNSQTFKPKEGGVAFAKAHEEFVKDPSNIEQMIDVIGKCHFEDDTQAMEFYEAVAKKPLNRSSTQTHAEVKDTAAELGFSMKDFDKAGVNNEDLPAMMLKARQVTHTFENVMAAIAKKENKTANDYVQYAKMLEMHYDVRMRLLNVKTNIARTMGAFRIKSAQNHGLNFDDVAESVLQQTGTKAKIRAVMESLDGIQNPAVIAKVIDNSKKTNFMYNVQTYWINALLSGPATHVRNTIGNLMAQTFKGMEIATSAAGFGKETKWQDFGAYIHGMVGGAMEALGLPVFKQSAHMEFKGNVWKAFMDNEGKIDPRSFLDVNPAATVNSKTMMGKMGKWVGNAVTMPSRALVTGDEFFKTMAYRADLRFQASIKARQAGVADRMEFIENFLNNPPEEAIARATKEMNVATFQNSGGEYMQALQRLTNAGDHHLLKFAMPFVRTPANILKFVGHRTPIINRFSSQMKADIAAGGIRKEMAEARVALGSTLYGVGLMLASTGVVTGTFDKKKHRSAEWEGSGAARLNLGSKSFDISTSDPIGAFFVMAADTHDLLDKASSDQLDSFMGACTAMIASNLSNRSYLKGLGQLITALTGDGIGSQESKMEWYSKQFVGSFIPNLMKQINRSEFDDTMRENRNFLDSIKKGVVGQSQELAPKLNPITGEVRKYGDSGFMGIKPFYSNGLSDDPLMKELARKEIPFDGVDWNINGVEISPEKRNEWTLAVARGVKDSKGRNLQQALRTLVQSKTYQSAPDRVSADDRRRTKDWMLNRIMSRYRGAGRRMFLQANPDINQQILMRKNGL